MQYSTIQNIIKRLQYHILYYTIYYTIPHHALLLYMQALGSWLGRRGSRRSQPTVPNFTCTIPERWVRPWSQVLCGRPAGSGRHVGWGQRFPDLGLAVSLNDLPFVARRFTQFFQRVLCKNASLNRTSVLIMMYIRKQSFFDCESRDLGMGKQKLLRKSLQVVLMLS